MNKYKTCRVKILPFTPTTDTYFSSMGFFLSISLTNRRKCPASTIVIIFKGHFDKSHCSKILTENGYVYSCHCKVCGTLLDEAHDLQNCHSINSFSGIWTIVVFFVRLSRSTFEILITIQLRMLSISFCPKCVHSYMFLWYFAGSSISLGLVMPKKFR